MNDATETLKTNEGQEQCTVSIGEDKTQTPYPEQVQPILNDFSNIFPTRFTCRVAATQGC